MSKLIYLNHSGFLLELEQAILVFDYYTDPAYILNTYTGTKKDVFFFVSHDHYDHWNMEILDFYSEGRKHYFLDASCSLPEGFEANPSDQFYSVDDGFVFCFPEDEQKRHGLQSVQCFGSTDEGVSFLLASDLGYIFHAGDLNFWDWEEEGKTDTEMEQLYRNELQKIKETVTGQKLWISMIPVDQRLATKAFLGATVFLEYCSTQYLVPDHLNGGMKLPALLDEHLSNFDFDVEVLAMTTPGQARSL